MSASDRAKHASLIDQATYWLTLVAVYFLVGVLFFYSGKAKLITEHGTAPAALHKQFAGTFLDTFPGINTSWVIIGVLEFGVCALMILSILRGEFLPDRAKSLLLVGLSLAFLVFAALSFGQTSAGNNAGTASLYAYFGATGVIFLIVRRLPPASPASWLSHGPAEE